MKFPQKINRLGRLLDFSPWILAIACFLLLLLLTMFGISNYQREKDLIVDGLGQKGLTLLRFMNSSVRGSIRDNLQFSQEPFRWEDHIQKAMEQAVEQHGIESILLVDSTGKILVGAGQKGTEKKVDPETLRFALGLEKSDPRQFVFRMIEKEGEREKIQIAAWYLPPDAHGRFPEYFKGRGFSGRRMMRFGHHPQFKKVQDSIRDLLSSRPMYIVELDFQQFNSPLQRQLLQIIVLAVVALLVGAGGILSYITLKGLKGSEIRLDKMSAFTDILVTSLPVGLIATDETGMVKIYNASARNLLEFAENDILNASPEKCLPAELARMFRQKETNNTAGYQTEIIFQRGKGDIKNLQLASVSIPDTSGNFSGEVVLIRDLTSFKRLEQELQRSERLAALGKMAAGVAHELRNPLSSIKGLAVLLQSHFPETGADADSAELLVGEVERLNRSIGELLEYAKPAKLNKKNLMLVEIIEKALSLVRIDAETYGIEIIKLYNDENPQVFGDRDKLNQVFLNIFLNAIQAMPGGDRLTVRCVVVESFVAVTVRDTGCGIAPEDLPRIFDPYYTTKSDGTGLGLALSLKMVEEHGGRMTMASIINNYSEVRIEFPCV